MNDEARDSRRQFGLAGLLLVMTAAALWLATFILLWNSPHVSPGLVGAVLCGITAAVAYLLRDRRSAWLIGALVAPLIALVGLSLAAIWQS